ncbi:hypothetical protein [Herpetosiphon llansteffanensis]|uniref:hypothetical protein n=1 Tax=Herpetosiphon llansteffanensis TaxID=2094568 RepID=UPI000D7BA1C4|nr:hypothetical protein [Herpetosiphon llansteffanensis]
MQYIDQQEMLRFAQWLVRREDGSLAALTLLKSVQSKSPLMGVRLSEAMTAVSEETRVALQREFSTEERAMLLGITGIDPKDIAWRPLSTAERQRKRHEALDDAAQALGFKTWSRFETAVINGSAKITVRMGMSRD